MSGIAAIIRFDGGSVEPGLIQSITKQMQYRGPDGVNHWHSGPVALGHCMFRTTEESLSETQPLSNEDESMILILDGWLSNLLARIRLVIGSNYIGRDEGVRRTEVSMSTGVCRLLSRSKIISICTSARLRKPAKP